MKKNRLFLVLMLPLLAMTCYTKEDIATRINIQNNTDKDLYCVVSYIFPDTTLSFAHQNVILANNQYLIKKKSTDNLGRISYCRLKTWDRVFPNGKMIIFYLEKKIVEQHSIEDIIKQNLIFRKEIYLFEDIKNCLIVIDE